MELTRITPALFALLAPVVAHAQTVKSPGIFEDVTFSLLLFFLGGLFVYLYSRFMGGRKTDLTPEEERRRTAILLTSSNTAFYYQNLTTKVEWVSRRLKRLLELPTKSDRLKDILDRLEENEADRLNQLIVDLKAGEESIRAEFKDRQGRVLECIGVIQTEQQNQHLILSWQDISQRNALLDKSCAENEKLKQEIQQYSHILNALPIPVWHRDTSLALRFCNLAYMEACEEVPESAGMEPLEITSQGRPLAQKALESGKPAKDRRHFVIGGERRLYDFHEIPWDGGKGLTGYALDVSELEKALEELERNKSSQSDLLESTASAIAIFGSNKKLQFFNNAFCKLWKLEEKWLKTGPHYGDILERLRENRALPEQANFPQFKQEHLKLFTDLLEPHEEFFYLPDGRTLRILVIPHSLGGLLFAYEDVTDRLALERSYNTLIAVQKETLDNLHEGVAVFGEDGRLKLTNPTYRNIWNLDEDTVKTEPHVADLLNRSKHLYYFGDWEEFRQDCINNLTRRSISHQRLERRDGKVYDIIFVPLPDGQTLLNYVDITDSTLLERSLREKNEALEEADRLKSEFLANVSYELRSPLTTISGYSEMLEQDYFGKLDDKQKGHIRTIHEASQQLMNLIDDILDIASIEAGYMRLDVHYFDIENMLATVNMLVSDKARYSKLQVSIDCPPDIGSMLGDENRLRQVMFNLASNAIKYTPAGGTVTIGAESLRREGEDWVRIWVSDTGMGISPDEQEAVFNKFYRGAMARKHRSGTGLGLSMVKSFVELHGGSVELQSAAGQGTTVSCYLKRKNADLSLINPETEQRVLRDNLLH